MLKYLSVIFLYCSSSIIFAADQETPSLPIWFNGMIQVVTHFYPQVIPICVSFMILCRAVSELLWAVAKATPSTEDDKIAAAFSKSIEMLARVFGNLGIGLPRSQVKARIADDEPPVKAV